MKGNSKDFEEGYRSEPKNIKKLKFKMIKENFAFHYDNNPVYREYCEMFPKYGLGGEIAPEDIKSYEDIYKIPLLPSDFFKELSKRDLEALIATQGVNIETYFTSSGTTGKPTKYPFDKDSISTVNEVNVYTCREILEIDDNDIIIFLTPSPSKSKTGLVQGGYMMFKDIVGENGIYFLYDKGLENPGKLLENLLTDIEKIKKEREGKVNLYGPPFVYYEISRELKEKDKSLNIDGKVMLTGGWKRIKGGEVPKEKLYEGITKTLGIEERDIRDGFGLTDIFMWCPECELHRKHVPIGVHVSIRDPENLVEPVESGKEGLIAFLSPYIRSYPPFVLPGDIGIETISEEEYCECGRLGNVIEHKRRVKGSMPKGCALVLEEIIKKMETSG